MSTKTKSPTKAKKPEKPKYQAPPKSPDDGPVYPQPPKEGGGDEPTHDVYVGPAVIPIGDRVKLRCYQFSVTNTDPKKTIVQINIPFDGDPQPIVPMGPPGWFVVPGTSVEFRTPPPLIGGQAVRPNGVAPGGLLSGFTFYLPDKGSVQSKPVVFTFADGSTDTLGQVFVDGTPVPAVKGAFRITTKKFAYCRTVKMVAPKNADVYGVEFMRLLGGNRTDFVGVEPPAGWVANDVEDSTITIFSQGARTPIPAGGSLTATLYYRSINARCRWRFLDIRNQQIPGAEGNVSLL